MASSSSGNNKNDGVSSQPLTEETTTTKRQRCTTTTTTTKTRQQTLTPPSLASSSSSTLPSDAPQLPTLPFELIVEILCKLPVKFLLQLRCICKSWKTLISDPNFAKKHLHGSPTTHFNSHHLVLSFTNPSREFILMSQPLSSVFNVVSTTQTQFLRYPLNNRNRFDLIVGSCHGILCFAIDQQFALLWNPSTGKFKKLPSLENPKREGSYTIYGFGYDHFTDSYKVVAVFCYECDNSYKTQVKVHVMGSSYWKGIREFPSGVPFDESGKFLSGTVNWLAASASSSSWVIVSLDLGSESYEELLGPGYGDVSGLTLTLGVLRDCLCILSHCDTFSDVWLMKDFGNKESWTQLCRVPYVGNPDSYPYTKALYISEDDEVLLEYQSKLVIHNSREGTFKVPDIEGINAWMVPEVYVESLISPCS